MNQSQHSRKTCLIVRLPSADGEAIEWQMRANSGDQIVAHGGGRAEQVRESLAGYPAPAFTRVLVPATDVTVHTLTLPAQVRRQLAQVVQFMLEDQLATDIEKLHFALLERQGETGTVAVVEKSRMRHWLSQCAESGIAADSLLPDAQVLPRHKDGWSALNHNGTWLFRQENGHAMAAESSWFAELLIACAPLPAIYCYSAAPVIGEGFSPTEWQTLPETDLFALAAKARLPPSADLRQGEFASVKAWRHTLLPWRGVAIALLCYMLLVIGEMGWTHYQLYRQAAYWRQESIRVYRQLFPSETAVINPRLQMQQRLQRASAVKGTQGLLSQLTALQQIITRNSDVQIQSLSYEASGSELRVALQATSYQALEQLQQQAAAYYQVQAGEMRQEEGYVEGRLTLRSRP
ncbi:general secretion pathway protein L|uniref:Type II secretion system protein L n=1 Tax=Brenneria salicis ATCC 15712 = DSM 30166 TaxID=714314 RepID=A0A366IAM8_9GAMM|nr:type II secretion system protein GspL [Brenneria salicis]NMN91006.1 general secretion pathway protein L [Brenneria salicis ATCC 15712 = DSM 30166]RBP66500.1 general secretion pathway protein L [Brenneria salicis ATCC 15712 = DSM 30166]RLM32048.1 type II secretion system protein GspL [Brenneria salicis ATCC 15712 = DSM 30166]